MWKSKKLYLYLLPFICFLGLLGLSKNANAEQIGRRYNTANVDFYAGQQIQATVNLPWSANPGTHRFFLNNVYFNENYFNGDKLSYIAGRMVMDIETRTFYDTYVCGTRTDYYGTSVTGATSNCLGSITIVYTDGNRSRGSDLPVNYNQSQATFNIYFDYSIPLEADKTIDFIQFRFYTRNGYDVFSKNVNNNSTVVSILLAGRGTINAYETPPSGADIANDLLQQQIGQNQTIINQNTEINQNIENINNTLTDSSVSGNFNTAPIQPFGPIGTITNSILDLPRVILNVTPCQPLTPELPYIHENIEIPCPSVFLNGMAGDFMAFLDVIASAGIWYLVARYIFKKVQKLRDPENTDEEYLDI